MTDKPFKAALFDLDGTLIDSMPYWKTLAEDFLDRRGITPTAEEKHAVERLSLAQSAFYIKNRYCLDESPDQILKEFNMMIDSIYRTDCSLKPGAAEYLAELKRAGIKMALVTITAKKSAKKVTKRLGINGFFSHIVTDLDAGKSKNHPDIYLMAAKKLRSAPEDTAVFEDSVTGGTVAKKAGFKVYAVRDGSNADKFEEFLALCDGPAPWQ
ncbi:MAG: HAD family phosphatase [Clostridia bacterium]|nr:HAD family phosphatase [Clostridia bacterium]